MRRSMTSWSRARGSISQPESGPAYIQPARIAGVRRDRKTVSEPATVAPAVPLFLRGRGRDHDPHAARGHAGRSRLWDRGLRRRPRRGDRAGAEFRFRPGDSRRQSQRPRGVSGGGRPGSNAACRSCSPPAMANAACPRLIATVRPCRSRSSWKTSTRRCDSPVTLTPKARGSLIVIAGHPAIPLRSASRFSLAVAGARP